MKRLLAHTLVWGAALILWAAAPVQAGLLFQPSYNASFTFRDALGGTTMTVAHDGSSYWSSSGGSAGGVRYARYNNAGSVIGTFSPGLDFRSVFTDAANIVYSRQFSDSRVFRQTAPGSFTTHVTLAGGLDQQSSVVLNGAGNEYIAMEGGSVRRWALNGNFLGTVNLAGFGSLGGENVYPQNRGIAATGPYYLTYNGNNRTLSAWDMAGVRVDTTVLNLAGQSFDSNFSLSYANGMVFIVDNAGGIWRGYDVGLAAVPEPGTLTIAGVAVLGLLGYRVRRRRAV